MLQYTREMIHLMRSDLSLAIIIAEQVIEQATGGARNLLYSPFELLSLPRGLAPPCAN